MLYPYMCQQQIYPSNAKCADHILCRYETTRSIYISYELNATHSVTRGPGVHAFHVTCICPWTNVPVTLHIYVPLHFYCSPHIDPTLYTYVPLYFYCSQYTDPTLLNIQVKRLQLLFTMLYPYMYQQQICLSNSKCANHILCRYKKTKSIHIAHMNSMQSTVWPGALVYMYSTLLVSAPEQMCLSHCT